MARDLRSFTVYDNQTNGFNDDGQGPVAGLVLAGNVLYGTAYDGGSSGNGTVFKVNTDATRFTNLYSFSGPYNNNAQITNNDGANPQAGLILSGNTLYGTASSGGLSGNGTVFAINTDGTGLPHLPVFQPPTRTVSTATEPIRKAV